MIYHIDLDCFFVSAERLRNPKLLGVPVAVGGSYERGVIASASYEARKYGIHSAMPTLQALRRLPSLVLVPVDHDYYHEISKKVFELVGDFSPRVEQVSIDEAYFEIGDRADEEEKEPDFFRIQAEKMKQQIFQELGLTVSIGVSSNKRVSKVASDFCKPNGICFVRPGKEKEFLAPFNIRKIPGVGPRFEKELNLEGIFQVKDLEGWSSEALLSRFGSYGEFLQEVKEGEGSQAFFEEAKNHSQSRETTFDEDTRDWMTLKETLYELSHELGVSLKNETQKELSFAKGVKIKIRYSDFKTISRQRSLRIPTQSEGLIFETASELLLSAWKGRKKIRLLGVGVYLGEEGKQQELFEDDFSQ